MAPRKNISTKKHEAALSAALERLRAVRAQIATLDLVAPGTLARRTKICGRSACACAHDPEARHGPYYEWGQMVGGRRSSEMLSKAKGRHLQAALLNRRRLDTLVRRWMDLSMKIIDARIALRVCP